MKSNMDHRSFFDRFFGDTPKHKCSRCGATANLVTIGSTGGAQLYLCRRCKEARDEERQERADRKRAEVERTARADEEER